MTSKIKTFTLFVLCALFMGGISPSWAGDSSDNVTSDQSLYQRVKRLGGYGLLDEQDKKVLDEGRVVTRLELAFYLEKAKARIEAPHALPTSVPAVSVPNAETPSLPPPVETAPSVPPPAAPAAPVLAADTPTPVPAIPSPSAAEPTPVPQAPPPAMPPPVLEQPAAPAAPPAPASPVMDKPAVKSEIEELLRELRHESAVLRTRLAQDDYRIHEQADELEKLKTVQDEVESAFKKANKTSGSPNFNSASNIRFENVHVSGITVVNVTKTIEDVNLGIWSDLGGKGSISVGLGGYIPLSNATAGAVSIYLFSPKINWAMDGKLGHWDANVVVEAYSADTDLGDFIRGSPPGNQRFELPFEIKKYSTDKNMKNWDDYMTNLGYVPSTTSWVSQSNSSIVFDGLYMIGSNLPLVSKDAKATILLGRMGRSATETQKMEEGLKYSQPWGNGFLQTSFSTLWINEDFGITAPGQPTLDLKTYGADLAFDLKPFFLDLKGGYSEFYTGVDTGNTVIKPFGAPGGQASLSFYPLTVYYTAIDENYANPQSKVIQAGFDVSKYGYALIPDSKWGFVGMVDDLISDRHGWRANLGWKGRQSDWMKDWPSLLDDLIVNFDVAQNTEYQVVMDNLGRNVVEAYNLVTVYYPDDTGLWGNNIWGGYGGGHAVGNAYGNNILAVRNDGFTGETIGIVGNGYTTRIPFILPVYSSPGVIQTTGVPAHNVYTQLDHLKTFQYITLTTKLQLNKMFGMSEPFYGSLFFTDHTVSGVTGGTLGAMQDPNRPGQTLASIPNMFNQRAYDAVLMYQVLKDVNLSADYGLETWKSDYTYPLVNWRTDSFGGGLAYDTPWGAGKFEFRYKHLINNDLALPANSFVADQIYAYFLMKF